jgi:predicted transcriptional regulator
MVADQVTTIRLGKDTLTLLDRMAKKLDVDRSTLIRRAVTKGARTVLLDEAVSQYLRRELSAGAASEWAGVSYIEFLDELRTRGLPYLADNEGIAEELAQFKSQVRPRGRRHR